MIVAIVGAGRSGTNILASAFEHESPRFKNLYENRYIWNYGQRNTACDLRGADEATPRVKEWIRKHFEAQMDTPETILIDKTPSNALRLPFVTAVYPEVRIINIIRDGRDNIVSRARFWLGQQKGDNLDNRPAKSLSGKARIVGQRMSHLRGLLAGGNLPVSRVPAMVRDYAPGMAQQMLTGRPQRFGERIAGLPQIQRAMGVDAAAAVQWRETVMAAHVDGRRLGSARYLEIRYEAFVANPAAVWDRILKFLDLTPTGEGTKYVEKNVKPQGEPDWRTGSVRERMIRVESQLRPTLEYLGYEWGLDAPAKRF